MLKWPKIPTAYRYSTYCFNFSALLSHGQSVLLLLRPVSDIPTHLRTYTHAHAHSHTRTQSVLFQGRHLAMWAKREELQWQSGRRTVTTPTTARQGGVDNVVSAHVCVCWWAKVIVGNINTKSVYDMKNVDSNCRIATAGCRECEGDSKRVNATRPHTYTLTHTEASRYTSTHSLSYSGLYYCARRLLLL